MKLGVAAVVCSLTGLFLAVAALALGDGHRAATPVLPSVASGPVLEGRQTARSARAIHREVPDDPPARRPAHPPEGVVARAAPVVRGPYESIQVNVDQFGNNIPGDAANESSMAIDATNPDRIVIGWRQFDTVLSNFRTSGYAYSHDRGQTWTNPGVLEPGEFSSDPVLASDLDGNIYYNGLQPNRGPGEWACYIYKSSDGGVTWPQEVYAFGGDKQWYAIDKTDGPGSGNIYSAWSPWAGCCTGFFTRSTNGGLSYLTPIAIPDSPFWGTLTVDPDGVLYVAGGTNYPIGPFVVARSTNAWDPLQTPTFDSSTLVSLDGFYGIYGGPNPGGLLGQLWIASDHSDGPTRGNLYLLASVVRSSVSDPLDVMFSRSTDGGLTWSAPIRVNDDPAGTNAWQWFGTMAVAPNGRIDVVWNDTRNSGADNLSELYYSFSADGGLTWSVNIPLSPMFDSFLGWPQQSKLGDYYHMLSDNAGASLAYAATFNGEQDVYFLRIDLDCNENGIPDDQEIADGISPDCNETGLPDECDIEGGTSPDCNGNGTPDECEMPPIDPGATDCNGNGVPDECDLDCQPNGVPDACECAPVDAPLPEQPFVATNRYLSVEPGSAGCRTGLRVTFVQLPSPFHVWNGMKLFAGEPFPVCENSGQGPNVPIENCGPAPGLEPNWFWAVPLVCDPVEAHFSDWTAYGVVHLFHEGIIPGGIYDVQAVSDGCPVQEDGSYSASLTITQAIWSDVCGPDIQQGAACATGPDGVVDVTNDALGVLGKFTNTLPLPKRRTDLEPGDDGARNGPDLLVNVANDVLFALEAFQGTPYPFTPTNPCAPGFVVEER